MERRNEPDFRGLNLMPASVDPMHYGHVRVLEAAEEFLGEEVSLLVVRNPFKPGGFFDEDERVEMAGWYLPGRKIFRAGDYDTIKRALHDAKLIVRGWRSTREEGEDQAIWRFYEFKDWMTKVYRAPKGMDSSGSIKQLVREGKIDEAQRVCMPRVVAAVQEKLRKLG